MGGRRIFFWGGRRRIVVVGSVVVRRSAGVFDGCVDGEMVWRRRRAKAEKGAERTA